MKAIMTVSEHEMDLALAAQLQAALLPGTCPDDCAQQRIGVRNRMSGSIGGDFYDFRSLNRDQFAIVIGDVVGHGIRAALLMTQIMGFLRRHTEDRSRPAAIARDVNAMLIDLGNQVDTILPCSLLYTVIDLPTGMGFMVNAGHPRPLICDRHQCNAHHMGGHDLVLGVEDTAFHEICHTFVPGERLVLRTDGITDAANEHHELFGEARLMDVLSACADADAQHTADAVMAAVEAFRGSAPQTDDETIVIVDRR